MAGHAHQIPFLYFLHSIMTVTVPAREEHGVLGAIVLQVGYYSTHDNSTLILAAENDTILYFILLIVNGDLLPLSTYHCKYNFNALINKHFI